MGQEGLTSVQETCGGPVYDLPLFSPLERGTLRVVDYGDAGWGRRTGRRDQETSYLLLSSFEKRLNPSRMRFVDPKALSTQKYPRFLESPFSGKLVHPRPGVGPGYFLRTPRPTTILPQWVSGGSPEF